MRLLCLKYSNLYKRFFSSSWIVVIVELGAFLIFFLSIKGRELFGSTPSQWHSSSSSDVKVLSSFFLACLILGSASQAALWTTSGRNHPPAIVEHLELRAINNNERHSPNETDQQVVPGDEESNLESNDRNRSVFVRIGEGRVSRTDVEVARGAATSFATLLVMAVPSLVVLFLFSGCLRQHDTLDDLFHCDRLVRTYVYSRALIPIYCSIPSPVIFILFSRDIRWAIRDKFSKIFIAVQNTRHFHAIVN